MAVSSARALTVTHVALATLMVSGLCADAWYSGDAEEFLRPQNQARARLGLPSLVWDEHLAGYANWWASHVRSFGDCRLQHSGGPYGENIFWGGRGRNWQPGDAIGQWVHEGQWYNHYSNSCYYYNACGHYTQVVWRRTTRVGCSRQICSDGNVFITCNYFPPGNWVGQRPY